MRGRPHRRAMFGNHGFAFWIDVGGTGNLERLPIPADTFARSLGGVGLAAQLLLNCQQSSVEPLSAKSVLVVAFSPLVGTPLTTSAKFAVVAKSPLTGRFCDAVSSSHFALAGKRTGADALCVTGCAEEWCVVVIEEDRLSLQPASDLVGWPARDAEMEVRARLGNAFEAMAIGPAAESLVPIAGISHDGRHAGRGGLGAILGAKRIKAIAVAGRQRTALAHPQRVMQLSRDLSTRSFGPATEKYRELGTVANLLTFNRLAVLPTRGFQESTFAAAEELSGETLATIAGKTRKSCASCTIGCEHIFPSPAGGVRVEYESMFALGSLCGIDDRDGVLAAAAACDRVGLDTISFGATYAFAAECVERGWLQPPGDIDLRFGNAESLLAAIELTAKRSGVGALLALGTRELGSRLGPEAAAMAPHVKGLEIPGYDPARLPMAALGFAVNPRGADHNRSSAYEVDFAAEADRNRPLLANVAKVVEAEDRAAILDSMILCKFVRGVFSDFFAESAELLEAVTGTHHTAASLRHVAHEIVSLKREFNRQAGWTLAEDTLPGRFLRGESPNSRPEAVFDRRLFDEFVCEYHRLRAGIGAHANEPTPDSGS